MSRLALEHLSAADRSYKVPVTDRDFAAHRHQVGPSFDFPAFKGAVIDIHQLRLRGNLSSILRIVDDQISVRADLDRAFAREQAKGLRRVRARDVDEGVQIEFPTLHSVGVEQVYPVFEGRNSVWDLGEIVAAHWFLAFEIERRVIGRDGLNFAAAQPIPKNRLIALVTQRRRHDELGPFELGALGVGLIEH